MKQILTSISLFSLLTASQFSEAQVILDCIPEPVNNVVTICAGSTILLQNGTDPVFLNGPTSYNWQVPGTAIDPLVGGPVFQQFDTPGTYSVSLNIVTLNGEVDLGTAELTIEVSEAPPIVPELISGHQCTQMDTLSLYTDVIVFQTQSGQSSCACNPVGIGPLVAINNTDQYPAGTVSHIYWGGAGLPANGGTNAFTTQTGFPTTSSTLQFYPGQINSSGHYSNQGSYNLVHVVEFPGDCTFSDYYVVSWGAALIDQCANAAQSVCFPLDYPLCFDTQAPGTTYNIDWGDGTSESYTYPNLPTIPNQLGHAYDESCANAESEATTYTITINANNTCENLTTENTQGPFFVSTSPLPGFTMSPEPPICLQENILFTDTSFSGFEAGVAGCYNEYRRFWTINGSSNSTGTGYQVASGNLGDPVWFESGSETILVDFTLPGTYDVTLTVSNTFCEPISVIQQVTVPEVPFSNDDEIHLCPGAALDFVPTSPPAIMPQGTTFTWTASDNPNVIGETSGSGNSIVGTLVNTTGEIQTVEYLVTPIYSSSCPSTSFNLTVFLHPEVVFSDMEKTSCSGIPVTLTPLEINPNLTNTTFDWSFDENPNIIGATEENGQAAFEQTLYTSITTPLQSISYEVLAITGEGCAPDTFNLVVHLNKVIAGTIGEDQLICPDATPEPLSIISAPSASGSLSLQWMEFNSNSGSYLPIPGSTNDELFIPPSINPIRQFSLKSTSTLNDTQCSAFTLPVTVEYLNQVFTSVSGEQTACAEAPLGPLSATTVFDADNLDWYWQIWQPTMNSWETIPDANTAEFLPDPSGFDRLYRPLVGLTVDGFSCTAQGPAIAIWINQVNAGQAAPQQSGCPGDDFIPLNVLNSFTDGTLSLEWYAASTASGPWALVGFGENFIPDAAFSEPEIFYRAKVTSTWNGTTCSSFSNLPLSIEQLPADVVGNCGGNCMWDLDANGICDINQTTGCMDLNACNFVSGAIEDDGSCSYPAYGFDCDGSCLLDTDGDGICDQNEIHGCLDPEAFNFNDMATDVGECFYGIDCPSDLNLDGIVGVSDILILLTSYGTSCEN